MGVSGNVFRSRRGSDIAGLLADMGKTITGKDALYYATTEHGVGSFGFRNLKSILYGTSQKDLVSQERAQWNRDRAEVAEFLKQQLRIEKVSIGYGDEWLIERAHEQAKDLSTTIDTK